MNDAQAQTQGAIGKGIESPNKTTAMDAIDKEIIGLLERQHAVINRLTSLRDRMYGETPEKIPEAEDPDHGPGKIGSINGHLLEAHYRMTTIESVIEQLSLL